MIMQLNPVIPVFVVSKNIAGYAFAMIDYSQEHNTLYVCGLDNGEVWTAPQSDIRMQKNWSLGRNI